MLIKTTKTLEFTINFIINFILMNLIGILFLMTNSITLFEMMLISLLLALVNSLLNMFLPFDNIVVNQDSIGSFPLKSTGLFTKYRKQYFITNKNVDIVRSQKRTFLNKLAGVYVIYDINGNGFLIKSFYFKKNDFIKIKKEVLRVYNFSL